MEEGYDIEQEDNSTIRIITLLFLIVVVTVFFVTNRDEWLEDGTEEVNGQPIHYCSFLNPVAHGKVFNFLFFVDAGHKRLIANINGNDKHVTRWSIIALEMIRSVEVASS